MKLQLFFDDIKPLSLNKAYANDPRTKRRFNSKDYNQYQSAINNELRKYKNQINKFNNAYDESKYYIVSSYRFYLPIMVKSNDRISKNSLDTSNCIKVLEDIIFKQLIADDSAVVDINAMKIHSEHLRIEVEFELKNLHHIN